MCDSFWPVGRGVHDGVRAGGRAPVMGARALRRHVQPAVRAEDREVRPLRGRPKSIVATRRREGDVDHVHRPTVPSRGARRRRRRRSARRPPAAGGGDDLVAGRPRSASTVATCSSRRRVDDPQRLVALVCDHSRPPAGSAARSLRPGDRGQRDQQDGSPSRHACPPSVEPANRTTPHRTGERVLASGRSTRRGAAMAQARRLRFWEKAAPALRVVGAILLAAGMIHLYAELVIFDARTFGARAALSLGDPRVAGFVAERIADEAIAQRRDLMAYRPLLVGTARDDRELRAVPGGLPPRRPERPRRPLLRERGAPGPLGPRPGRPRPQRARPRPRARRPHPRRACARASRSGRAARGAKALVELVKLGHRFRRNALLAIGSGVAAPLAGHRPAARPAPGAPERRGGPRHRRPRPLLPAAPRPHRPHRSRCRARSCGRWRPGSGTPSRAGSACGRSSSPASASSSPRRRPRSRATWRSSRSHGASGRGCRSRPGRGRARSSGPPSSPGSASSPRSARPRPCRA